MKFVPPFIKNIGKQILNAFGYEVARKDGKKKGIKTNHYWLVHFLYMNRLYERIKDVDGNVVECGVGRGNTFYKLYLLASQEGKNREVWCFDSFKGFPDPSKEDISPRDPKKGEWNVAKPEDIYEFLDQGGIPKGFIDDNVKLITGYFEDSLGHYSGEKIAYLHLDIDLYQSYKTTLEHFWPLLSPGGVVLFDEYKQPGVEEVFPGAAKAIDEFFGDRKSSIQYDGVAQRYYIIKTA